MGDVAIEPYSSLVSFYKLQEVKRKRSEIRTMSVSCSWLKSSG